MTVENRPPHVTTNGWAVLPAIGVPLDVKSEFECPVGHLEFLKRALPEVSSILTIGWRANEAHFLELLRDGVRQPVTALSVAADQTSAQETLSRLSAAGVPMKNSIPSAETFTRFVVNSDLDNFLAGKLG